MIASPRGAIVDRLALRVLQAGALAVVLVSAPYKSFDLDRFFVPKELALGVAALVASVLLLSRARRAELDRVDKQLGYWLLLGFVSALFATNHWLAGRAVALSLGGAACFWCARAIARAGYGRQLVAALALAGVVGAATALLQAYGVRTEFFSLNRAPGGTFGNRNFMAHLCVIVLPALLFSALRTPTRAGFLRWCGGLAIVMGALILSRTRAAWLALIVGLVVLLVAGVWALRGNDGSLRLRRLVVLALAAIGGTGLALMIPNRLDWRSDSPYLETAQGLVNYKGGSGKGRLTQYGNSLRMTLRHPVLGVGPGNWAVVYPRFASDHDPSLGRDGMTSNPWPSSDWVTFLSERGPIALVALSLAMLALAVNGVRALRAPTGTEARLTAAVLLSTLATIGTVGAFDAVLLLPVAALVGWSLLGALAVQAPSVAVVELPVARRLIALALVLTIGSIVVLRSARQLTAMSLYATSSRPAVLERASAMDPGSYRIHSRLSQLYLGRRDCKRARPHAMAARALFPSAPQPKRALAVCGEGRA